MKPFVTRPVPAARLSLMLLACLLASGCGLSRQLEPVSVLAPDVTFSPDEAWPSVDWSIQVRRPVSDRMRDSERLFVRVGGSRLQAYPGTVWLDQTPDMIQALTVQALEDSARFEGVGRAGAVRSRFALDTEIRRFEAVDRGAADLAVDVVIQARLVAQRSGQVVATRTFEMNQASSGQQLDALVTAFELALADYFGQLLPWVLVQGQQVAETDLERTRTRPRRMD